MTQAAGYPGFYLFGRTTVGWLVESHTADKTAAAGWSPTAYAQYYDPAQSNVDTKLVPLSQSVGGFGVASCGIKNPRGPTMAKQFNNSMYASNTVPCLCLCLCLCVRVSVCPCVRVFVCRARICRRSTCTYICISNAGGIEFCHSFALQWMKPLARL